MGYLCSPIVASQTSPGSLRKKRGLPDSVNTQASPAMPSVVAGDDDLGSAAFSLDDFKSGPVVERLFTLPRPLGGRRISTAIVGLECPQCFQFWADGGVVPPASSPLPESASAVPSEAELFPAGVRRQMVFKTSSALPRYGGLGGEGAELDPLATNVAAAPASELEADENSLIYQSLESLLKVLGNAADIGVPTNALAKTLGDSIGLQSTDGPSPSPSPSVETLQRQAAALASEPDSKSQGGRMAPDVIAGICIVAGGIALIAAVVGSVLIRKRQRIQQQQIVEFLTSDIAT